VQKLPEDGSVAPKHGAIYDNSIVDAYVSMCILLASYKKISLLKCTR